MDIWLDFPPEILEKILDNVEDIITLKNARHVNTTWKKEMDKILAKKDFFTWVDWQPSRLYSTPSVDTFPKIHWSCYGVVEETIWFPSLSPSFHLYFGRPVGNEDLISMKSEDFWNEYGATTRNLSIDGYQALSFHHRILSLVPKIEGIRFYILECHEDDDIPFLQANPPPCLPKLKHLEIWEVIPQNSLSWMAAVNWLMEAYGHRLVSLKLGYASTNPFNSLLDEGRGHEMSQISFENLQVLFLNNVPTSFYQCFTYMPLLTHLSLMQSIFFLGKPRPMRLEILVILLRFIDKFSDTLVKLNLDINISALENERESNIFGCRSAAKLFSRLTVFAYNFPVGRLQSSLMKKWFLGRFPSLQKLQFFKYPLDPYDTVEQENEGCFVGGIKGLLRMAGFYTEKVMNDEELMKRFVEKECYLKVVPTLQTISVRKFKREDIWEDFELLTIKRHVM